MIEAGLVYTIPELLQDSKVIDLGWDRATETMTIAFDALRRNVDGSAISDRTVRFAIRGVHSIAVSYDSVFPFARPSSFQPQSRITVEHLQNWSFRTQEAFLSINIYEHEQEALEAARIDWLHAHENSFRESVWRLGLFFNQWLDFGRPAISVVLLIGATDFEVISGGAPLSILEWTEQFRAWWRGWNEHWSSKEGGADSKSCVEDTFIPADSSEPAVPVYRPPSEPVWEMDSTDTPAGIVDTLRDWFEGHFARDWQRLATAYPQPGESQEKRAHKLRECAAYERGFCRYARAIDKWWLEGRRACALVRGIEYVMPIDGHCAENHEVVWSFDLRLRHGRWIIRTFAKEGT